MQIFEKSYLVEGNIFKKVKLALNWADMMFYLVLAIPMFLIAVTTVYPTVDGAAHLYNSEIVKELLFNPLSAYHQSYEFNAVIVPNWLGHVIIGFLLTFLPALLAQKVFLLFLVLSMALVFRKLVATLVPDNKWLLVLIMPFIFSSFFHLGLYNQQLSFVLFLSFLHFMIGKENKNNFRAGFYVGIFVYSILLWSCSIMTFGVMLIFLLVHFLVGWVQKKQLIKEVVIKAVLMLLMVLPTLWLTYRFIAGVKMISEEKVFTLKEKLAMIFSLRPLITFSYNGELIYMVGFALVILFLMVIGYLKSYGTKVSVFFISVLCMIVLCFSMAVFVPNESGAGMITYRLLMVGYLFLLVLIMSFKYSSKVKVVVFVVVGILFIGLVFKRHNGRIRSNAANAYSFYECGRFIKQGSLVLPIQIGKSWFTGHINNYCAIQNKAIILNNYEACLPWFPVQWKSSCSSIYKQIANESKKEEVEKALFKHADCILFYDLSGGKKELDSVLKAKGLADLLLPSWHSSNNNIFLLEVKK